MFSQKWVTLLEGQVYFTTVAGHVSKETIQQIDCEFCAILDTTTASKVHLIIDTRCALSVPPISENRKIVFPSHPRMGYAITIAAFHNQMLRLIIAMSAAVTGLRYKDVVTLEDACAFLRDKDSVLPPLHDWPRPSKGDFMML